MKNTTNIILLAGLLLNIDANAASFNCIKSTTKIEKTICSDSALSAADERLAQRYTELLRTFPIPEFIKDSERVWLHNLPSCLPPTRTHSTTTASNCIDSFLARISTLNNYEKANVYTNYGRHFDHDSVTILIYKDDDNSIWLEWFGQWMPDAYQPKPFPDGFLAQDKDKLVAHEGNFTLEHYKDVSVLVADDKITISGDGISLSARQEAISGDFIKVR